MFTALLMFLVYCMAVVGGLILFGGALFLTGYVMVLFIKTVAEKIRDISRKEDKGA